MTRLLIGMVMPFEEDDAAGMPPGSVPLWDVYALLRLTGGQIRFEMGFRAVLGQMIGFGMFDDPSRPDCREFEARPQGVSVLEATILGGGGRIVWIDLIVALQTMPGNIPASGGWLTNGAIPLHSLQASCSEEGARWASRRLKTSVKIGRGTDPAAFRERSGEARSAV